MHNFKIYLSKTLRHIIYSNFYLEYYSCPSFYVLFLCNNSIRSICRGKEGKFSFGTHKIEKAEMADIHLACDEVFLY